MKLLESKVPPIVAFLAAAIMWGIAKEAPAIDIGACDPRRRKDELFFADKFEPTVKASGPMLRSQSFLASTTLT